MKIVLQYQNPLLILDAGESCSGKGYFANMMIKKGSGESEGGQKTCPELVSGFLSPRPTSFLPA